MLSDALTMRTRYRSAVDCSQVSLCYEEDPVRHNHLLRFIKVKEERFGLHFMDFVPGPSIYPDHDDNGGPIA